ncbi:alkaline phosphatase, partial [Granulosicoccus sp.]|nr:alkaline phosphatase [Granulosicoccus sp.]
DQQSVPSLKHLTSVALNALASFEEPFLLLLETEELDSSGHWRNEKRLLRGLDAMQDTVTVVFDFLERHPDTLFVFTSDHETGGLILKSDWTDRRVKPVFQSFGHTGSVVPVMAVGPADTEFIGFHTNDGLGRLLKSLIN